MIGAAPFLGGGLIAAGSGGGCPSPVTDTQDPASPSSSCSYGPSPGSGSSGNCEGSGGGPGGGGGTCSAPDGGNGNGGGGSGDSLGYTRLQGIMPLSAGNSGSAMCCDRSGGGPAGGGFVGWGGDVAFINGVPSGGSSGFWQSVGWAVDTGSLPQCDAPPGGPSPNPVPGSGGSTTVTTKAGPNAVRDLPITCVETGVTLTGACAGVTFFGTVANMTYKTPGGLGRVCVSGLPQGNFLPASVVDHNFTGTVSIPVSTV